MLEREQVLWALKRELQKSGISFIPRLSMPSKLRALFKFTPSPLPQMRQEEMDLVHRLALALNFKSGDYLVDESTELRINRIADLVVILGEGNADMAKFNKSSINTIHVEHPRAMLEDLQVKKRVWERLKPHKL